MNNRIDELCTKADAFTKRVDSLVTRKDAGKPLPGGRPTDIAYKGYMIKFGMAGRIWIEKGGSHIGFASSVEEAKKTIDQLV